MLHPLRENRRSPPLTLSAVVHRHHSPHVTGVIPIVVPTLDRANLTHLVRSMDTKYGETGCQNRDDPLNQGQPCKCDFCIISYNEA
jgi:hypothetical protein